MQFLKMELACLGVMAYLTLYFFRGKRPATMSNLACRSMLISGTVTLVLESVAVLLVNYFFLVPEWLTKIAHQAFYLSLCVFLFMACRYMLSIVTAKNLMHQTLQVGLLVPIFCALFMILLTTVYFQTSSALAYASGPMTYTYTLCALIYMGISLFYYFSYKDGLDAQKREALTPVAVTVMALALFQIIVPSALLSGIAVVLLSLAVVLSMENPAECLAPGSHYFNRKAFSTMADDILLREKPVHAIFVLYKQMAQMEDNFGKSCVENLIEQLKQYLFNTFALELYMPLDGCAAVFVSDPSRAETIVFGLEQRFQNEWMVLGVPLNIHANICHLTMPDPYTTVDEMMGAVIEQSSKEETDVSEMDKKLGILNKNAFKRAMIQLHQNKEAYSSIHYLVADITGMRSINEEFGFVTGDVLLKDCANILQTAAGEGIEVYRVGGDEFAMLLISKTDNDIRELLDRIQTEREKRNKDAVVKLELSIAYSRYNENSDRSFNSMIARAEYQMTTQKRYAEQEVDLYNTTRLGTRLLK